MLNEIRQQPDVIQKVVELEKSKAEALAKEVKARGIENIIVAARGTSDNAARFGKYLFDVKNGMPTNLAAMSVVTLYQAEIKLDKTLVIGVSQSGAATDVAEYMIWAKKMGALTAGITNEENSRLTQVSDYSIMCNAGPERSVAATKTYTASLAALHLISACLSGETSMIDQLLTVSDPMREVIEMSDYIRDKAERYRYMEACFVLARGINHATGFEAALKMAETCGVWANAYSAADFLHGPIAASSHGFPCFLYAPSGKALPSMIDVAEKLKARGAELVITGHDQEILKLATTAFRINSEIDELFSPLVYIIAGQLFAYHLSISRGFDPDRPEGLTKVTLTR